MKIIINGKTAILRKVILFKFVFENCSVMLRSISVFIIVDILNLETAGGKTPHRAVGADAQGVSARTLPRPVQ